MNRRACITLSSVIFLLFSSKDVICMNFKIVDCKLLMQTVELMPKFDDRDHSPVDKDSQSFDKVFSVCTLIVNNL